MKIVIFALTTILLGNIAMAVPPMKYNSSSIKDSNGRNIGRMVERSSGGGIKYNEYYDLSGHKTTMRTAKPVYNHRIHSPTTLPYRSPTKK